jgi:hypothetical protein
MTSIETRIGVSVAVAVVGGVLTYCGITKLCRCGSERAMSTYGTTVSGVGTTHAPMSSCGIAATLQFLATALLTKAAFATIMGVTAGVLCYVYM